MTAMIALAAACAAGASAALLPAGPSRRLPLRGGPPPRRAARPSRRSPVRGVVLGGAVLGAGVVAAVVITPAALLVAAVLAGAAVVRAELQVVRAARRAAAERLSIAEFTGAFAAELRAGREPRAALLAAAATSPAGQWRSPLVTAVGSGADVGAALRAAGGMPGADQLRALAACWQVAERSGAGLAAGAAAAAAAAAGEAAHRRRVAAELAGVRATGWLLAALPLLGMLLGAVMGAEPWRVLLATPGGAVLLAVGLAFDVLGLLWVRRLARSAEAAA